MDWTESIDIWMNKLFDILKKNRSEREHKDKSSDNAIIG